VGNEYLTVINASSSAKEDRATASQTKVHCATPAESTQDGAGTRSKKCKKGSSKKWSEIKEGTRGGAGGGRGGKSSNNYLEPPTPKKDSGTDIA